MSNKEKKDVAADTPNTMRKSLLLLPSLMSIRQQKI